MSTETERPMGWVEFDEGELIPGWLLAVRPIQGDATFGSDVEVFSDEGGCEVWPMRPLREDECLVRITGVPTSVHGAPARWNMEPRAVHVIPTPDTGGGEHG